VGGESVQNAIEIAAGLDAQESRPGIAPTSCSI
jgi:hypothetical protein